MTAPSISVRCVVLSLLAIVVGSLPSVASGYSVSAVSSWTTVPLIPSLRLSPQPSSTFTAATCSSAAAQGLPTLSITSTQLQPLIGYGAALTETAAYLFLQLKARNASAYSALLDSLFAPAPLGIAMSFMRVPIGSCDMNLPTTGWSYDDTANDLDLSHFNLSHGLAYQLPVLADIMSLAQSYGLSIRIIGTPWSAPAWTKTSGAFYNGTLRNDLYGWYAQYLTKVVLSFQSLGIPMYAISLQNEPQYSWQDYPSMPMSTDNETTLAGLLKPALQAAGLSTLVTILDSDWSYAPFALQVMQDVGGAGQTVDAVAFHCYSGSADVQSAFHSLYPTVPIFQTECSAFGAELSLYDFQADFLRYLPLVYFGVLNNWGSVTQHWELAMDRSFGPTSGGCDYCMGTVLVDATDPSVPYTVQYSSEYYAIGHFSAFLPPFSYRLQSALQAPGPGLQTLTALTPDGSVVVQLLNMNATATSVLVQDATAQSCFIATLQPMSLSTYKYATGSSSSSSGLSGGAIAGIVLAALVVVLFGAVAAVLCYRRLLVLKTERYVGQQDERGGGQGETELS